MVFGSCSITYAAMLENSVALVLPFLLSGIVGWLLCRSIFGGKSLEEQRAFLWIYSLYLIALGVARTSAVIYLDEIQIDSDAQSFFEIASLPNLDLESEEIAAMINGWGAVRVWALFYALFEGVSEAPSQLVGISVNCLAMALAGGVTVNCLRVLVPGSSAARVRAMRLWGSCFLFWLLATIHLRDSFCLLVVSILINVWLRALATERTAWMGTAILASVVGQWVLSTFRAESGSIAFIMLAIGLVARYVLRGGKAGFVLAFGLGIAIIGLYEVIIVKLLGAVDMLRFVKEGYSSMADEASLGNRLVVSAAAPLRLLLGWGYVHVFPIPIWQGFTTSSAYYWFKSAQVVSMCFLLPATVAGVWYGMREVGRLRAAMFFLTLVYGIITSAVVMSSLETRHHGQVLPLAIIVAAVAAGSPNVSKLESRLRAWAWVVLVAIHVLWFAMKISK